MTKPLTAFKTKAGTELPLLNLKGKAYLAVQWRLVWFREERPNWSIMTEIVERNEKYAICKSIISKEDGQIMATAHKREDAAHFPDFLEKCETSAIGRALALCGFGTQFAADDLFEGERLADAPVGPSNAVPQPCPNGGDGRIDLSLMDSKSQARLPTAKAHKKSSTPIDPERAGITSELLKNVPTYEQMTNDPISALIGRLFEGKGKTSDLTNQELSKLAITVENKIEELSQK